MMKKSLILMALALVAGPVHAQKFSYNYAEAGAEQREIKLDDVILETDSAAVGWNMDYQGRLLMGLEFSVANTDLEHDPAFNGVKSTEFSDKVTGIKAFFGGSQQVSRTASAHMGLGVGVSEMEVRRATAFPGGYALRKGENLDTAEYFAFFGGRQWILPGVEVNGELRAEHVDMDFFGNDTFVSYKVGLRVQPIDSLSIGGSYQRDFEGDMESVGASVRWIYDK